MKRINNILLYIFIGFILTGLVIRFFGNSGGSPLASIGFLGMFVYYIIKTKKDLRNKVDRNILIIDALIVLMTLTLHSKYLFFQYLDYPSLIIVPFFIFISVLFLFIDRLREFKLSITIIFYLLLSIPLFGFDFHKSPRHYIPIEWYNRYDTEKDIKVNLPFGFKYIDTEELSIKAHALRESKKYFDAIFLYRKALKLEPNNPKLLFDLSETYARVNDLETAISLLDTAIKVDSTYSGFYNNRGLLYYKLKQNDKAVEDYNRAITLDSTQSLFHANLALAYYYMEKFDKACESIFKAEQLGLDITELKELKRIKKNHCK